jgi:3-hydroxyacyl-CoA dehydrogenase
MLLLLEAQEGNWDEIDQMIRAFQKATTGLRYSRCRSSSQYAGWRLAAAAKLPSMATASGRRRNVYGLVETGVGLIPAGGSAKKWC